MISHDTCVGVKEGHEKEKNKKGNDHDWSKFLILESDSIQFLEICCFSSVGTEKKSMRLVAY